MQQTRIGTITRRSNALIGRALQSLRSEQMRKLAVILTLFAAFLGQLDLVAGLFRPDMTKTENALIAETLAAFDWLKTNTSKNAVILAPPYEAHRIMAFADRRVIASGKVYPSETEELAERLKDLSTFFFTTDISEAEGIADKYGAQYVFLPRNPRFLEFCEPAGACFWATYRGQKNLTPDGRNATTIGKLLSKTDMQEFRPIWISPNFLIYRITKNTERAPCEISEDEKALAIRIVRVALENRDPMDTISIPQDSIFDDRCAADIALWDNGKRIFDAVVRGETLLDALKDGAARASLLIRTKDTAGSAIVLNIWDEHQMIPWDAIPRNKKIDPQTGYIFEFEKKSYFFFPYMLAEESLGEAPDIGTVFDKFCEEQGLSENACEETSVRAGSFPINAWVEYGDGFKNLYGVVDLDKTPADVTPALIRKRTVMALDSLVGEERGGGFEKFYAPWQRLLAAKALADGYIRFGIDGYLASAKNLLVAISELEDGTYPTLTLVYAADAYDTIWRATKENTYLNERTQALATLSSLRSSNGFAPQFTKFGNKFTGGTAPRDPITEAAAFYALAEHGNTAEENKQETDKNLAAALLSDFLERRIRANYIKLDALRPSVEEGAWLIKGFRKVDEKIAADVGRWLLELQETNGAAGTMGAFRWAAEGLPAHSKNSALATNALAEYPDTYGEALEKAFAWLMLLQYDENSPHRGAFRTSFLDTKFSADIAANFAIAAIKYLNHVENIRE